MTWLDDMKRDAVRIALPDYELQPGDRISFKVSTDEGTDCTFTREDSDMEITIEILPVVDFDTDGSSRYRYWWINGNDDVQSFFTRLMELGSKHGGT